MPPRRCARLHRRWLMAMLLDGWTDEQIRTGALHDDDLPCPSAEELRDLRASLAVPRGFNARAKAHSLTRKCLTGLGLAEVFGRLGPRGPSARGSFVTGEPAR